MLKIKDLTPAGSGFSMPAERAAASPCAAPRVAYRAASSAGERNSLLTVIVRQTFPVDPRWISLRILFPISQRRHGDFRVFRISPMHRLGVVAQRLLREPLRETICRAWRTTFAPIFDPFLPQRRQRPVTHRWGSTACRRNLTIQTGISQAECGRRRNRVAPGHFSPRLRLQYA